MPKTVQSEVGPLGLDLPRDRNSTFEPRLAPKGERRLAGLDEQIISPYAGGREVLDKRLRELNRGVKVEEVERRLRLGAARLLTDAPESTEAISTSRLSIRCRRLADVTCEKDPRSPAHR